MAAELDSIVRVTSQIAPRSASGSTFGRSLYVYAGDASAATRADILGVLARDSRVNVYRNLAAVRDDYAATHAAYRQALSFFSVVPSPRREFMSAGWFESGSKGYMVGATGQTGATVLSAIQAVGATTISAAGQAVAVDLSGSTTGTPGYEAAATVIETALQTITSPDLSAVTCAYSATDGAFLVTVPVDIDIGGALSGPGAEAVGLAGTGSTYVGGVPTETSDGALDRIEEADDSVYWLVPDSSIYTDETSIQAAAAWLADREKQMLVEQHDINALTTDETTSITAELFADEMRQVTIVWGLTEDQKAASVAGLFAGVDLDEPDSLITAFGKTLPGRTPDSLSTAQRAELDRKRVNYYTTVGGSNVFRPGVTTHPDWYMDTLFLIDWLKDRVRDDIWRLIRTSPRIPLDMRGNARIQSTVETVCEAGRRNGGLAPGRVSETFASDIRSVTGAAFDGMLGQGYLVYVEPLSGLSETELAARPARQAPTTYVWLRGAGAAHGIEIPLMFSE